MKKQKLLRIAAWAAGSIAALLLIIYVVGQLTPWPSVLLIRNEFKKGGDRTSAALEKHVPAGIQSVRDQQYRAGDKDAYLDVFYPNGAAEQNKPKATVVWVHGGAWVAGNKNEVANYLKILAGRGFVTVGVNYSIAPEKHYPTPILQVNEALAYLKSNAERLNIDPNTIVLAGDSAGSQIVAQIATAVTSKAYAGELGIQPVITKEQLRGVVLNCGAYDLELAARDEKFGSFLKTVLWAYSGRKDFLTNSYLRPASVVNYVTRDFPSTFITAGNVDPLENQSRELAKRLTTLGVPTDTLFYPENHQPQLNHEYQFDLDTADGQQALQRIVSFIGAVATQD